MLVVAPGNRYISFNEQLGMTPLMFSVLSVNSDVQCARFLIQNGASLNTRMEVTYVVCGAADFNRMEAQHII